ncbi:hypothetical protein FNV43_RR03495 [Rhamnella rubrinervis]|uniref:Fe2OG dioxygenase domain-containing protein n=1 Tax=Rhamnella rubrinervis TaxID=2594499 RepID=A0A8K0HHV6_9ROSA|nr:hypothetical protein FNV43_RR03495 [Rhamnella rubrinervis]
MAGFLLPAERVSESNNVMEMPINSQEPPAQFIVKETRFGSVDGSPPLASIPVVDLSQLFSEDELDKLRSALCSWGCFQAIGHGVSSSFIDKVREVAEKFISLPLEEKQKSLRAVGESEGFGGNTVVSENQVLDWCNRLSLQVFPEHKRRLNLWPLNPHDFGETLLEYSLKIRSIMELVFKAIATTLKLDDENVFLKKFGEGSGLRAQFSFYPPCQRSDMVLGLKAHSDRSGVTVLLQDKQVEGLQVRKDNSWYRVPVIPHAFLINLGDQMEILCNGIYKSPIHRVTTNTEKIRSSVAMFIEPAPEQEIGPVEELVDEKRPKLYKTVKNYGAFNYECFQKGLVALEAIKI